MANAQLLWDPGGRLVIVASLACKVADVVPGDRAQRGCYPQRPDALVEGVLPGLVGDELVDLANQHRPGRVCRVAATVTVSAMPRS